MDPGRSKERGNANEVPAAVADRVGHKTALANESDRHTKVGVAIGHQGERGGP